MPEKVPSYEEFVQLKQENAAFNEKLVVLRERVEELEGSGGGDPNPPTPGTTRVGSSVGFKSGFTYSELIQEFEGLTGGFVVRRCYDPDVPADFDSSSLRHDHGDRMQAWSFKPDASTTVSEVTDLLHSVPYPEMVWIIPYHEPVDNMDFLEYRRRYDIVYEAYRNNGSFAGIGPCLTNFSIEHRNGLQYVQPDKATFLSVDYYADLAHDSTPFPNPVDELGTAMSYANDNGLAFAVDEFGVDHRNTGRIYDQVNWIEGFKDLGAETNLLRLCWWNQDADNIACRLEEADPRILGAWMDLRDFYN